MFTLAEEHSFFGEKTVVDWGPELDSTLERCYLRKKIENKKKFGNRFLSNDEDVYRYNAWDNVEWDEKQIECASKIISSQLDEKMCEEDSFNFIDNANSYWNSFYKIHRDQFYKNRHWLFNEFPELKSVISSSKMNDTKVIFEVGCGVGNTVFPILEYHKNNNIHVYCCDFSEEAINLMTSNLLFDSEKCTPFVFDITDTNSAVPFETESVDIIILIYVLSSIPPSTIKFVLRRLHTFLKPGGLILFRDYGKYDLSQLRFKNKQCISNNFYVRGEGTLVYFFDKDEISNMFTECGYEIVQNIYDKRLQVNRKKKLKMYRVWVQGKFKKIVP